MTPEERQAVMRLQERLARLEQCLREVHNRLQQVEATRIRLQGNLAPTPTQCECTAHNAVSR
jgi:hypothetical protein